MAPQLVLFSISTHTFVDNNNLTMILNNLPKEP